MIKRIIPLIILVCLTSSCSIYHITSTSTTDDYYPAQETTEVVYLDRIDDAYTIIGAITVNAERRQRLDNVIEKMKHEAAIMGGEAITDIQSNATGPWKRLPIQQTIGNAYVRANFTASVVVSSE